MAYDDIIIGAGLSGLATAMGLPRGRRILVLTEPAPGQVRYYDPSSSVPNAMRGPGGLGNYWHGVISFAARAAFTRGNKESFQHLFSRFYPDVSIEHRYGTNWLFVPRRPIRPAEWWSRLIAEREGSLELVPATALRFSTAPEGVRVETADVRLETSRLWICSGALDTPTLLSKSLEGDFGFRGMASDHMIVYLGQIDRRTSPSIPPIEVQRLTNGYWLKALAESTTDCLVTAKPAWFSFRHLDYGTEKRAAFGLPIGGAVSKILRSGSLGLIAEAAFNKSGLFAGSPVQSLYGQVRIEAAHSVDLESGLVKLNEATVRRQLDAARSDAIVPGMLRSRRPDLFLRGIHLHDTLDATALAKAGVNGSTSRIRVQDASAIGSIGGEHHSFHMMAAAFTASKQV